MEAREKMKVHHEIPTIPVRVLPALPEDMTRKTPVNPTPLLSCDNCRTWTAHAFVEKVVINDDAAKFVSRNLIFMCLTCRRERVFGWERT